MRKLTSLVLWFFFVLLGYLASAQNTTVPRSVSCADNGMFCTEAYDSIGYGSKYTGHDEPSLLFYSNTPGSGNTMVYLMQLPTDPPQLPKQDGTGGTFNFQIHPTFWVGMAMCDDQSAPNPGGSKVAGPNIPCTPDSDSNIFDSATLSAPNYMGKHPGGAFMEMQFYPPGWAPFIIGISCDPTRWCSALTIDSFSENENTGADQNAACQAAALGGIEYVNFAFITKSGVPVGPPSPLLFTDATFTPSGDTLFYNSGDVLRIVLNDTAHGLKITISDLTTGESGSMTASANNGFAQILFDPKGKNCNPATHNLPYDFHPMYATSSEHTRLQWTSHSYNIAFSDEIGHFEYCNAVDQNGNCTQDGVHDLDNGLPAGAEDDFNCVDASASLLIPISGCTFTDFDFDGVSYQLVWPGTSLGTDQQFHPSSILFSSPLFTNSNTSAQQNYNRVAFEANLPRIESNTNPPCQRHVSNPTDPNPGQGCVNPPVGANFYPFYSTRGGSSACTWQLGGDNIPGTKNTFGGSSATEFGSTPLALVYPATGGLVQIIDEDFRQVLSTNPCPSSGAIAAH
jgi:hypothetical protein